MKNMPVLVSRASIVEIHISHYLLIKATLEVFIGPYKNCFVCKVFVLVYNIIHLTHLRKCHFH